MKILSKVVFFIILASSILMTGCLQIKGEILLNEDGSGTVVVTEAITSEGLLVLQGLSATGQIPDIDYISSLTEIDEEELRARASDFTDGLKFESGEEVTFEDGSVGRVTRYTFKDISKVKIYEDDDNHDNSVVDIEYKRGSLAITSEIKDDEYSDFLGGLEDIEKLPSPIKPFFKGMKLSLILKTPSPLRKTTASYPLKDKSGIILLSMDLGKIINSPMALAALKNFSFELETSSSKKAKGFEYFKVEPKEKIIVEF